MWSDADAGAKEGAARREKRLRPSGPGATLLDAAANRGSTVLFPPFDDVDASLKPALVAAATRLLRRELVLAAALELISEVADGAPADERAREELVAEWTRRGLALDKDAYGYVPPPTQPRPGAWS